MSSTHQFPAVWQSHLEGMFLKLQSLWEMNATHLAWQVRRLSNLMVYNCRVTCFLMDLYGGYYYLFLIIILRLYTIDYYTQISNGLINQLLGWSGHKKYAEWFLPLCFCKSLYVTLQGEKPNLYQPLFSEKIPPSSAGGHHPGPHMILPLAPWSTKPSGSRCDGLNQPHLGKKTTGDMQLDQPKTLCLVVSTPEAV